tara:strand:+ start:20055 stop:25886 length:5832 start_codon:yes stop_codon:yes gene_type:complete
LPVYNDPNIKNIAGYVGLREWDYALRDTSLTSPDYFGIVEFPQKFTAGKNLIKLRAHPNNLVPDSDIHIEILDANENPIYYEPLKYIQSDYARVIAVWIYSDTVPGPCQVYIAGRALKNADTGLTLPWSRNVNNDEYKDIPNVLWKRSIPVTPFDKNKSEIIHLGSPHVHIKEIVQTYMKPINLADIVQTKSGSSAQTQTVTLRPITIAGTAGTANIIPSTTTAPNINALAAAVSAIQGKQMSPGAVTATGATGPGATTGLGVNTTTSTTGQSAVFVQGSNSAASVPPNLGGNMQMMAQISMGPAMSVSSGGGLESVEFLGYTSYTGLSELEFTDFPLSASMEGGTITIVNPNIDTDLLSGIVSGLDPGIYPFSQHREDTTSAAMFAGTHALSGSFEFKIIDVISTYKCHVQYVSGLTNNNDYIGNGDFQLKVARLRPGGSIIEPTALDRITATSNFTSSHTEPFVLGYTEASQSFAEIIISNMEPATGDVYKMKTQYKPGGAFGEYIDLGDTIVEHTHMLVDYNTMESDASTGVDYNKIGHFSSLVDFQNYWDVDNFPIANENIATATYEPDLLMSGIRLTPSVNSFNSSTRRFSGMHLKSDYHIDLTENTKYVFNLKGYAEDSLSGTDDPRFPYPRVDIYISGSGVTPEQGLDTFKIQNTYIGDAYTDTSDFDYTNGKFGTRICSLEVDGSGSLSPNTQAMFRAIEDGKIDIFFVVRRGNWSFGKINLFTHTDTGWTPNYTRQNVRIPSAFLKTPLAFKFNFYDYTGTVAEASPIAYPITFTGENNYIDGTNNLITGSVYIGNSVGNGIELAGVNSAYLRSIGYEGSGDVVGGSGRGGFMIYSGSVLPGKTTYANGAYQGVGIELIADDDSSHLIFGTSPSVLDVKTDQFFLGSTSQFVSGANGNIEISSSDFHLSADGQIIMQGTIEAEAGGTIGGFTIGSDGMTATNFNLDSTGSRIELGSGDDIFIADADEGMWLGSSSKVEAPFNVSLAGQVTASDMLLTGGTIDASPYWKIDRSTDDSEPAGFISSSKFKVSAGGRVTGSQVIFTGGEIAGWEFDNEKLTGGALELNKSGYVKSGTSWQISSSAATADPVGFISSSAFKVSAGGRLTASAANIEGHIRATSGEFLGDVTATHINTDSGSIGGFTLGPSAFITDTFQLSSSQDTSDPVSFISSSTFKVSADGRTTGSQVLFTGGRIAGFTFDSNLLSAGSGATNFTIDANGKSIELGDPLVGSGNYFKVDADDGIQLGHSTFASAPFSVTKAGVLKAESGTIAGWSLSSEHIQGGALVLDKNGSIYSDGFQSSTVPLGGAGFLLTVNDGTGASFLEVENARIRGTLSTAVFEKETVNAVGGQLIVANSTTLDSSSMVAATDTTMSVMNVSGFTAGEILFAKKVNSTGFNTEYFLVESASRDPEDSSNENDLKGRLYVQRGYGTAIVGVTGSLPGTVGDATTYTGSQVLVSTGKLGTGFIHMNANPNDGYTPYIDIVERTGSGLYDAKKVARLGDLSGVTDTINGKTVSGYGLYTDNAFLKGGIVATYGLIGGFGISSTEISSSNHNLILRDSGDITGSQVLFTGGKIGGFNISDTKLSVSDVFAISSSTNVNDPASFISSSDFKVSADGKITGSNVLFTGGGIGGFTLSSTEISSSGLLLKSGGQITGSNVLFTGGGIGGFTLSSTEISSSGLLLKSGGQITGSNVLFTGGKVGGLTIASDKLYVGTGTHNNANTAFYVEDDGKFSLKDKLSWNGTTLSVTGTVSITGGDLAGVSANTISGSVPGQVSANIGGTGVTTITGDKISTGNIESTNWDANSGSRLDLDNGTITLGGSYKPGFHVNQVGLVTATNFSRKTVTVNAANRHLYRTANGSDYNLIFDGSDGGEVCMHIVIDCDFCEGASIKGFVVPQSSASIDCQVTVDVLTTGQQFDDGAISPNIKSFNDFID